MRRRLSGLAAVLTVLAASALASPAHADEASAETPVVRPPKPSPAVGLTFGGGYGVRKLFSLPITGGAASAGVDVQFSRRFALWAGPQLFLGSTENGLHVRSATLSAGGDLVLDRFRLGLGLGGMWIGVERATRDKVIPTWGPLLLAAARLDVLRGDDYAIFVRAALEGGVELRSGVPFAGPTVGAGFDLDVAGGSREKLR